MGFSWKRNLFVLWIGTFLVGTAYSVSMPFMPIFLQEDLGVTNHLEAWTGCILAVTFLASSLIAPFWGSLADKYGRRPMMLRAGICLSLAYFLYFLVQNPYELILARILEGLLAGYIPSAITLVATQTPEKHTGYALGIISTATAASSILGPLAGGVISHWIGTRPTFFIAGVMVFNAFLIAFFWVKEPLFKKSDAKRSSVLQDLKEAAANRNLVRILLLIFITSTSIMLVEPLLTIYVLKLGADQSSASLHSGIIFSAVGIATLIAAPRWGSIGGRIGYGKVLFIGLLGGGIGNLLQLAFSHLLGFGLLRFGYGLFFAGVFPALNASIVRNTDPDFRGRAFSLNQMANQLGIMVGPIVGGILAAQFSIPIVFMINGLLLLMVALLLRTPNFSFFHFRAHQQTESTPSEG
ncbi:MFS transporter [Paenibacillus cremeus]|uniref:Multidrug efflux MFS transporter n=1 Tax=Paenibacillus cremeus TaxID=2163881 RepID=A0A559KC48_9BACL|nr:MFS transporter [Paenibacillus cremeus]TVY09706.1 multidrug efflux MFS transporter [Paenibacillus cremeus]